MEYLSQFISLVLHLDKYLDIFFTQYGSWLYLLLFAVIFCETGLVVTPFLPGDSLLFAAGALVARSHHVLNLHSLFCLLFLASFLGNLLNYSIGRWAGPKVFASEESTWFNRQYLERAHQFYETYGGKTIVIARFMPIIRTFAPFVAGIGGMNWQRFNLYNGLGALLWIGGLLYTSFWFGHLDVVRQHFSLIVMGIIVVSLLPVAYELIISAKQRYS